MASRGFILGTVIAAFSAIVVGYVFTQNSNASTLYCVSGLSSSLKTMSTARPPAKCFRVQNGIFTEVLAAIPEGNNEKITYLDGHVLPGIMESHGHILQYGEMLESVSLYDSGSVAEIRSRIKDFLKQHEGEGYGTHHKWIRGIGWDQKYFGGIMPTAVCLSPL